MDSLRLARRGALVTGGAALVVMGAFTAGCSSTKEEPAPPASTATTAPSSPLTLTPTEKAAGQGGNNSFSPTVNPVPPGATCARISNGVCVR